MSLGTLMNTMAQEADEAITEAYSTVMRNMFAVANIYIFSTVVEFGICSCQRMCCTLKSPAR